MEIKKRLMGLTDFKVKIGFNKLFSPDKYLSVPMLNATSLEHPPLKVVFRVLKSKYLCSFPEKGNDKYE